ncbi:MAG: HEAT repeat domain-containing protein [Deltaproteobacteria bacterium]|nr:HEAT repeat domain-containing protein [Deltaproteobacteria bacterium]
MSFASSLQDRRPGCVFLLVGSLSTLFAPVARVAEAAQDAKLDRLYATIRSDSAYKVRMQAIRILIRRLTQAQAQAQAEAQATAMAPDEAMEVLSAAARTDENYLVRGLACFSLGRLADVRGRPALKASLHDSHPFVRAQAEEGLKALEHLQAPTPNAGGHDPSRADSGSRGGGPPGTDARIRLMIVAEPVKPGAGPGSEVAFADGFAAYFNEGFSRRIDRRFEIARAGQRGDGGGYRIAGSLADLQIHDLGNGMQRVTMMVRVSISTVPENNLRHVISAKASAQVRKGSPISSSLRKQLLHAATDKAIADSLAQLGGG